MFTERMNIFEAAPGNEHLVDRELNSAWVLANPGYQYAVYFPYQSSVTLEIEVSGNLTVEWLEIEENRWQSGNIVYKNGYLKLESPGSGHWIALINVS